MKRNRPSQLWLGLRICFLLLLAGVVMDATARTERTVSRWRERPSSSAAPSTPLASIHALDTMDATAITSTKAPLDLPRFWLETQEGTKTLVVDLPEEEQPLRYQVVIHARYGSCLHRWTVPSDDGWNAIRTWEEPEYPKNPFQRRFRARLAMDARSLEIPPGMSDLLLLAVAVQTIPLRMSLADVTLHTHILTAPIPETRRARALNIHRCTPAELEQANNNQLLSPTP